MGKIPTCNKQCHWPQWSQGWWEHVYGMLLPDGGQCRKNQNVLGKYPSQEFFSPSNAKLFYWWGQEQGLVFSHLGSIPTCEMGCLGQVCVHDYDMYQEHAYDMLVTPTLVCSLCAKVTEKSYEYWKAQKQTALPGLGGGTSTHITSHLCNISSFPFKQASYNTETFDILLSLFFCFSDLWLEIQLQSQRVSLSLSWLSEMQNNSIWRESLTRSAHILCYLLLGGIQTIPAIIKGNCKNPVTVHSRPKPLQKGVLKAITFPLPASPSPLPPRIEINSGFLSCLIIYLDVYSIAKKYITNIMFPV